MKFKDALNFSTGMSSSSLYPLDSSSCWSLPNRSSYHSQPIDVSCEISH